MKHAAAVAAVVGAAAAGMPSAEAATAVPREIEEEVAPAATERANTPGEEKDEDVMEVALIDWPAKQERDPILKEVRKWYFDGVAMAAGYELKPWATQMDRLAVVNDTVGRWWIEPDGDAPSAWSPPVGTSGTDMYH